MDDSAKARALNRARQRRYRAGLSAGGRRLLVAEPFTVTTDAIPGYRVLRVVGIVSAEVARIGDLFSNLAVEWRDGWGGRSKALEELLATARYECLADLRHNAHMAGANAILRVRVDVEAPTKAALLATATGTAVVVEADAASGEEDAAEEQSAETLADEAGESTAGVSSPRPVGSPSSDGSVELECSRCTARFRVFPDAEDAASCPGCGAVALGFRAIEGEGGDVGGP